ncbi:hypothetical protein BaRGS_00021212 [Batillaria attramentaria]|uniref:Uncharacterized protein n=1 Tax=Batillaria attramentaria TaxID=370345 RepID=A0ABD0KL25_9CAEN
MLWALPRAATPTTDLEPTTGYSSTYPQGSVTELGLLVTSRNVTACRERAWWVWPVRRLVFTHNVIFIAHSVITTGIVLSFSEYIDAIETYRFEE